MKKLLLSIVCCFVFALTFGQTPDSLKIGSKIDSTLVLTKLDSVQIKLDSLLLPFYTIEFDSTLMEKVYNPRFRQTLNPLTNDTIYVPLPKQARFLSIKNNLKIAPITIVNPIKPTEIDTTKMAKLPVWWNHKNS